MEINRFFFLERERERWKPLPSSLHGLILLALPLNYLSHPRQPNKRARLVNGQCPLILTNKKKADAPFNPSKTHVLPDTGPSMQAQYAFLEPNVTTTSVRIAVFVQPIKSKAQQENTKSRAPQTRTCSGARTAPSE